MNPYNRGSALGAIMPVLLAAVLLSERADDRGVLPLPKDQPYDREKEKRHSEERIEAARLKRERKAAKRAKRNKV